MKGHSCYMLPILTTAVYRKGLRKVHGPHMAPVNAATRRWLTVMGVAAVLGFLTGLLAQRR
ncbi:MAG: hypothetical protein GY796_00760 [Chloroflexi bacterium]|nr:hypothetical protein [Chloroflexota bacterium]